MAAPVFALLGAESTGKSTLAAALGDTLAAEGRRVVVVAEYLREFCDHHGRTPRIDEQAGIAAEQTRRIDAAAESPDTDLVIADTSALMIAVYSDHVFGDRSLYAQAQADQRRYRLTLLTALDLPWQPDGLQRDGPQVRGPVDTRVRAALMAADLPYTVVGGSGPVRLANALQALRHALGAPTAAHREASNPARRRGWQALCERCGDPDCERRVLAHG
jgi:nicotinamide riboside kinase